MMEHSGEWIYALFFRRLRAGWLVGSDGESVIDLANQTLAALTRSQPDFILISTADVVDFIANLMAGSRLGVPIFLCNPDWGKTEWDQVSKLTSQVDKQQHQHTMMIPTGGSSGTVKFAIHNWQTLSASAWGFQTFYQVNKINTVCTLPLYHVSGLMQLVRSLLTDGKLLVINFHQLCIAPHLGTNQIDLARFFISLVPTQLSKLLDLDSQWLVQFQTILLGGAPPSIDLLNRARAALIPLALTYGMTETASQVTSLKHTEFLAGNNSCGRVLPHAKIELIPLDHNCEKSIRIKSESLMLGYFPDLDLPSYFEPDDLGSFDPHNYLTVLGRNSSKIITGGENVFPIEVMNVIMATGLVSDVWVIGLADRYWGQIVVAIYVENDLPVSGEVLARSIAGNISKYKMPKYWISVPQIPRNSLGKVLVHQLEALLKFADL